MVANHLGISEVYQTAGLSCSGQDGIGCDLVLFGSVACPRPLSSLYLKYAVLVLEDNRKEAESNNRNILIGSASV